MSSTQLKPFSGQILSRALQQIENSDEKSVQDIFARIKYIFFFAQYECGDYNPHPQCTDTSTIIIGQLTDGNYFRFYFYMAPFDYSDLDEITISTDVMTLLKKSWRPFDSFGNGKDFAQIFYDFQNSPETAHFQLEYFKIG